MTGFPPEWAIIIEIPRERPADFAPITPELEVAHGKILGWIKAGTPESSDPVILAFEAHGRPFTDGYIDFRMEWVS